MPYRQPTHGSLDRMLLIHDRLTRGHVVNCAAAGRACQVSRQTIQRDIDYMRDRLGLPIEFDTRRNTYLYTETVGAFPMLKVSEGEVFSLLVAGQALELYRGTPFHRQLKASFAKLTAGLRDEVSFSPGEEMRSVSFKSVGQGKSDLACFEVLNRGLLRRREIEFDYRKPGGRTTSHRRVHPYHLSLRANLWYLVGFDVERKRLRTFAVPRIRAATLTDRNFVRPSDFSAEAHFAGALGVLGGDGRHIVRVQFRGAAADLVGEREWHESQTLRPLPDGGVELEMTLGALAEAEHWVLQWGEDAEVHAPKELRDRVARRIEEMRKRYR